MYDNIDDLYPENKKKNSRHKELLDQLRSVEDMSYDYSQTPSNNFLPSNMLKPQKEEKKKESEDDYTSDEWFAALKELKVRKPRSGKSKDLFNFDVFDKKKKKKKDKKKNELTDYYKEFETELNLYRNLLLDQNKFTETLQREYDSMKSIKSSARGVNKVMNDLTININQARALSKDLVKENVNIKKIIAELSMKEKKELGGGLGEGGNMNDVAANYLKQMISERQAVIGATGVADVSDYTDDDLFATLSENLGETDRAEEADKYLKYENRNVTVYATVNENDSTDYDFVAKDDTGEIIYDYPLPSKTQLSINRSTDIATDIYGKKYHIIWR